MNKIASDIKYKKAGVPAGVAGGMKRQRAREFSAFLSGLNSDISNCKGVDDDCIIAAVNTNKTSISLPLSKKEEIRLRGSVNLNFVLSSDSNLQKNAARLTDLVMENL